MKSLKYIVAIFAVCMIVAIPQASFAQKKQSLCLTADDNLITKRKCKGALTPYKPSEDTGACSSCGRDMTGEWSYTPIDNMNSPGTQRTITFTQSGGFFEGSNDFHTIMGKVEGNWLRLTQTVSGEEGEGFVLLAEGAIKEFESGFLLAPLAVTGDTFGNGGALVLRRSAP